MNNFTFHNPVRIVFGKGTISELGKLVPPGGRILLTYGGGSIKANGVYDQVKQALAGRDLLEFGGIEPNPRYETLMQAVELARRENIAFLLSVGGGSVLDGTKFIAAAVPFRDGDPWAIPAQDAEVKSALPLGCVLTLPATGSEWNCFAVISRAATQEKVPFASPLVYPKFSILDPETTFSLPPRQTANGVVDAWVHVAEQYLTAGTSAPLQERQAEAILCTLREEGPKVLAEPRNYAARANVMWCAASALNGLLSVGATEDWSTHQMGHELTAFYGLDHAQSLAVVLPGVLRHQKAGKLARLCQYGRRVFGLTKRGKEAQAEAAIAATEEFFRSLGVKTRLSEYGVPADAPARVAERFKGRSPAGELDNLGPREIEQILTSRM